MKKTDQLNVRLETDLLGDLQLVAEYEHSGVPELVRELIRDKVRETRKDRRFEGWLEKRPKEAE